MTRREGPEAGLTARIGDFLRARGQPASSVLLSERFLMMSVISEELATKLLTGLLEPAGLSYEEGRGWSAPPPGKSSAPEASFVGAVLAPGSSEVVLAGPDGVEPAGLAGATLVMRDPTRDAGPVRVWLRRRGIEPPEGIVSLRRAVRGAVRVRRGASPEDLCAALGVRWLDTEDARGAARALAECASEAARRTLAQELEGGEPPALPSGIGRETLQGLPEGPGVYRFYDAAGALIYVGKAASLKRRIGSYFTVSASRRRRRFYSGIHRLEYETRGSELEALLAEARQIERRAPEGNVQVSVRERAGSYLASRALALLLPRAGGGGVTAVVVRDGRYLGHAAIGPRGGGWAAARRLLSRALRKKAARPGRRSAREERDSAILRSWLNRHGELCSRVDLDGFRSAAEAARALRRAASALRSEADPQIFR